MTLTVIDIGRDQAGINLANVACNAVIVAICDAWTNNPYADRQYQEARRLGRRVGVYQFYRNNPSEADYFVSQIRGYVGQAVVIIDAETDGGPAMVGAVMEAGRRILAGTGVRPMVYVPPNLLNKYNWQPCVAAGYALWLPAYVAGDTPIYGFNPPAGLLPPKWWNTCAMWQFTSTGRLPGWSGNLDLSIFYGDGKAWDAFTRPSITGQSTTVNHIKGAFMALTDAQQAQLFNNINVLVQRTAPVHRGDNDIPMLQEIADAKTWAINNNTALKHLTSTASNLTVGIAGLLARPAGSATVDVAALATELKANLAPDIVAALATQLAK